MKILPYPGHSIQDVYQSIIGGTQELYDHPILCNAMLNCSTEDNLGYQASIFKHHEKYYGKPKAVLELACGTGTLVPHAYRKGCNAQGIDNSKQLVDKANSLNQGTYHHADISRFKLPDKFDMASITWCTLTYLTHQDFVSHMQSVSRCLNPGGVYYVGLGDYFNANYNPEFIWEYSEPSNYLGEHWCVEFSEQQTFSGYKHIIFAVVVEDKCIAAKQRICPHSLNEFRAYYKTWGFKTLEFKQVLEYKNGYKLIANDVTPDLAVLIK